MRGIKFRFWDETYEKFYIKQLYNDREDNTFPSPNSPMGKLKSPQQYTGLKDKNGGEIFEGDVLKATDGSLRVVEFVNGAFYPFWSRDEFIDCLCEVIGNIYENPELLNPDSAEPRADV